MLPTPTKIPTTIPPIPTNPTTTNTTTATESSIQQPCATATTPSLPLGSSSMVMKVATSTSSSKTNAIASLSSSPDAVDVIPTDATCVEFLDIMKAFSESSCNVTEMVERVDSLVHQDEQLLRLLPITTTCTSETPSPQTSPFSSSSIQPLLVQTSRGSTSSMSGMTTDEDRVKKDEENEEEDDLLDDLDVDMDEDDYYDEEEDDFEEEEDDEEDEEEEDEEGDSKSESSSCKTSKKRVMAKLGDLVDEAMTIGGDDTGTSTRSKEEQDWMELELVLDHSMMDPYDAALHLPGSEPSGLQSGESPLKKALAMKPTSATNKGESCGTLSTAVSSITSVRNRFRSLATSAFDKKSVTAALFDYDDEEEDDDGDLVLLNSLARKKSAQVASTTSSGPPVTSGVSAVSSTGSSTANKPAEGETKSDEDANAIVWGMEVDTYEQDLLSSIDHSVLCDRENRFLQWDLEIEAATAAAAAAAAVAAQQQKPEMRTPPSSFSASSSIGFGSSVVDSARHKMLMAPSPRDLKKTQGNGTSVAKSPSKVDTNPMGDDWNTLDFGTFQNRTVSHILSSCLHKRKLHHPYKDRVTLINFNVPGGEPIGPPSGQPSSSLSTSLFLGVPHGGDVMRSGHSGLSLLKEPGKNGKGTGEKKPKKPREERKRATAQKLHELLGDFEGGFTEQDLDSRGAGKMFKFDNLPLADYLNLPQDLKDLKRKIEATEHKVEGTKHRHRKGGPCPRCQVQNQLRAAKRAYHKRAVAHKKLPQVGGAAPSGVMNVVNAPSFASPLVTSTATVLTGTTTPRFVPATATPSTTITPQARSTPTSAVPTFVQPTLSTQVTPSPNIVSTPSPMNAAMLSATRLAGVTEMSNAGFPITRTMPPTIVNTFRPTSTTIKRSIPSSAISTGGTTSVGITNMNIASSVLTPAAIMGATMTTPSPQQQRPTAH